MNAILNLQGRKKKDDYKLKKFKEKQKAVEKAPEAYKNFKQNNKNAKYYKDNDQKLN